MQIVKQLLITAVLLGPLVGQAGEIWGQWKTIDDETGKAKSIVELYEKDGKLYGKVIDLLLKPDDTLCDKCTGKRHNQPIVGMDFLTHMEKDGEAYSGGEILDPANGKTYRCKLWLADGVLKVRGYIGFFFRTQEWHRVQ